MSQGPGTFEQLPSLPEGRGAVARPGGGSTSGAKASPLQAAGEPARAERDGGSELISSEVETDQQEGGVVDLSVAGGEAAQSARRFGLPSSAASLVPAEGRGRVAPVFADAHAAPDVVRTGINNVSLVGLFEDDASVDGPVDAVLVKSAFAEGSEAPMQTPTPRPSGPKASPQAKPSAPAGGSKGGQAAPRPSAPGAVSASSDAGLTDSHGGSKKKSSSKKTSIDVDLPPPGAIIDKYRLEELVGKGGFAAVYRATHLLLNVPVAIKLLRPKAMKKHVGLAALLCEEARFAARIDHPNVVRIQDVTHTPAITYIVMEFLEGGTLEQLIRAQGRLPPTRVLQVGLDVTAGLKAGLAQGLIHRDIKPSNILFSRSGVTKIVDLGLAQSNSSVEEPTLLVPGEEAPKRFSIVGTPAYMAPEQGIRPGRVDFRADIYALGVTLYHAGVGRPPFPIDKPDRAMQLHRTEPVTPPENIVPTFPLPVSKLLLWMLEKSPDMRPASYEALQTAMEEALADLRGA